jgi:hypothetical protein
MPQVCMEPPAPRLSHTGTLNSIHLDLAAAGKTVPPGLATQRLFGPAVTCGRFTRIFVSLP